MDIWIIGASVSVSSVISGELTVASCAYYYYQTIAYYNCQTNVSSYCLVVIDRGVVLRCNTHLEEVDCAF